MPHTRNQSFSSHSSPLLWLERLLWGIGLSCLAVVGFAALDARWFAFREGHLLDTALRGSGPAGQSAGLADDLDGLRSTPQAAGSPKRGPGRLAEGSLIGRIKIPRLGISALVVEGVSGSTLRRGVGHIPATSLPQVPGNVGLAGHRDTVFRGLKDILKDDSVILETLTGSYRYKVDWARVVEPDDVAVLAASSLPELTLVTCYPFRYVGAAPERFIVRAHGLPTAAAPVH
jgi:sortase A